jgi:hypothetical protein
VAAKTKGYVILRETILYLRMCSDLPLDELLKRVNADRPPGTFDNKWVYTDEPLPGSGDSRCVDCADGGGKKHWVFNC